MKQRRIVYKVCHVDKDGGLHSAYHAQGLYGLSKTYAIGKTTLPVKGTLLFAFDDIRSAKSVVLKNKKLFRAYAVVKQERTNYTIYAFAPNRFCERRILFSAAREWWSIVISRGSLKLAPHGDWACPGGTVLCSRITLIEEVQS